MRKMKKLNKWERAAIGDLMASAFATEMVYGQGKKWRDTAITTTVGNQVIDTCYAPDTSKWETGIERNGKWTIVEEYKNKEEAQKGHKGWVKKIKDNPKLEIKEACSQWDR